MKKLLAIMMAMVMVFALTVAVAADWSGDFASPGGGWNTQIPASDTSLVDAAEAIGDDAVITFTVTLKADLSTYSYGQVQVRDGSWGEWPGDEYGNYSLFDIHTDGLTYSITYGDLKAALAAGGWDVHNVMFICNAPGDTDGWDLNVTVTGAAAAPAEDNTPAEDDAPAENDAPAADAAPAEPSAPATGLALAVVPAVMALAAVAVSKKH